MKKNILQDVIPPKKSIRNLELPSRSRRSTDKSVAKEDIITRAKSHTHRTVENVKTPKEEKTVRNYKFEYDDSRKSSKKVLYAASLILILALMFGISALFKSAVIKITPKQEFKTLNQTFTAKKDSTTGLGFQLVTIAKDAEKSVNATTQQKVEKKATGRIIIYNNFSAQSQRLVATTRFETAEGLIFRLINDALVPGTTVKDGKTVAGSLEVQVEADKAGEEYNVGLKDFTIPGFKGDPKYAKIYGRSKTSMSGGFSGMQNVVSKEVMDEAENSLEAELKSSLVKDIFSQIPANFVLYENSISYEFEPVIVSSSTGGGTILKKKGTASGIILDKGSLSRVIMAETIPAASNELVKVVNLEKLNFKISVADSFNPATSNTVTFDLTGEANFVWVIDENKLKSDLLGLSKKSAETVIGANSNITNALVDTSPFWTNSIPADPEKVQLINTLN